MVMLSTWWCATTEIGSASSTSAPLKYMRCSNPAGFEITALASIGRSLRPSHSIVLASECCTIE